MAEKMANAEETAGSYVVQVEGDIDIDPSLVSRSVYVTGFQPTTTWESLMIHFQRERNGGGDIDHIAISKRGAAVITFHSPGGKMFMVNLCPQFIFQIFRRSTHASEHLYGHGRSMFSHSVTCLEIKVNAHSMQSGCLSFSITVRSGTVLRFLLR